jgi:Domain of unknown function (DUF3644)
MRRPTALTDEEKRVVKALLADGMRNQDIHALINHGRVATVNFGRITGVKKNTKVTPASAEEVAFFRRKKHSFDPVTGLNVYGDERLIRSREAMILAVTIFNSGGYRFKTEIFSILANIAWTYLMHEYYERKGIQPLNADGTAFGLSYMLSRPDCLLSKGIKNNLFALKAIRDEAEHRMLGRSDVKWLPLFQACCLNFDKTLMNWFGSRVSLQSELSIALQFGKLELEQAAQISAYDIPPNITALDALLKKDMKEEDLDDFEYQFRVVYTFDSASKGKAHIHFISPHSEEGQTVHNVLQKFRIADELYRYKPSDVSKLVREASGRPFSVNTLGRNTKSAPQLGRSRQKRRTEISAFIIPLTATTPITISGSSCSSRNRVAQDPRQQIKLQKKHKAKHNHRHNLIVHDSRQSLANGRPLHAANAFHWSA